MKIKIIRVNAVGEEFEDLLPGSIHETVECAAKYLSRDKKGGYVGSVWVMGKSERVCLLKGEFEFIED